MKALLLNGSPKNSGSTSVLIERVRQGLIRNGYETAVFCLGDMNIGYCKGCRHCYDSGECIISDDMQEIMDAFEESDVVVIGTPSYWGDVTGQLKVFFDRSTPYCDTNPRLNNIKRPGKGIALAVRTGISEKENEGIIDSINHYFGHMGISPAGCLSAVGIDSPGDLEENPDYLRQAFGLGMNI